MWKTTARRKDKLLFMSAGDRKGSNRLKLNQREFRWDIKSLGFFSSCETCAPLGWFAICKCSFGKALAAAEITISSPSAQMILSGGWLKGKITFNSSFQLCFVWFLLWMQKVTRVILSSLVGALWPGRHLVLQTVVWWEKTLVVHPKIVQKNIPKTPNSSSRELQMQTTVKARSQLM